MPSVLRSMGPRFALFSLFWWLPIASQAQDDGTESVAESDTSPFELIVGLGGRNNDNIFTTPEPAIDSWIDVQTLSLRLSGQPSQHLFEFEYDGEFAQYRDSNADNYDDHELAARGMFDFSRRSELELIGTFEKGHDDRGSGVTEGIGPGSSLFPAEPDEFDLLGYRGKYSFGADDAFGKLELEAGYRDTEYQNHLSRNEFFNRDLKFVGGAYHHRVQPKTAVVLDIRATEIAYDVPRLVNPVPDSTEYLYRLGVTWDTTAKTTGIVKLGYLTKDFDDATRVDFDGFSWEVDIRWSPRTYSHFDLRTARETDESLSLQAGYIDREWIIVGWTHDWGQRWSSDLAVGYENDDYVGIPREEELRWISLMFEYEIGQRFTLFAGVRITKQDSPLAQFAFDRNLFEIGIDTEIF